MPSAALTSLKTAIDQLVAERDAVKERLDHLDESLDSLRKSYNVLAALERNQPVDNLEIAPRPRKPIKLKRMKTFHVVSVKNPDKSEVAAQVAAMLMDSDKPLSRREIFDRLTENGVEIKGKDPEMVLSTMLWRAGEEFNIENRKGVGYVLKGKDYGIFD